MPMNLSTLKQTIDNELEQRLDLTSQLSPALVESMRYSILGRGKRLRGCLTYATATGLGGEPQSALAPASSIELIHAFSLIHDDLPDMDDSDTRRGKPSCHIQFGNFMAILAGDAIHALAFELVADAQGLSAEQKVECSSVLAHASGWNGMMGGQAMDMELMSEDEPTLEQHQALNQAKTGALFKASLELGSIAAGHMKSSETFIVLQQVGVHLGIAFQLKDDVLDTIGQSNCMGKPTGVDLKIGKRNSIAFLGVENAQRESERQLKSALELMGDVPGDMSLVAELAKRCVHRSN